MKEFWVQWHASHGSLGHAIAGVLRRRATGGDGDGQSDLDRIHLFAGTFADEADMFAYCFTPVSTNGPEQLNLDLPNASVNTHLVDALYDEQIQSRLTEYFGRKARRRILWQLHGANALVLVPTRAFDGLPFQLHDTPRLRHVGYENSLVPVTWAMAE